MILDACCDGGGIHRVERRWGHPPRILMSACSVALVGASLYGLLNFLFEAERRSASGHRLTSSAAQSSNI